MTGDHAQRGIDFDKPNAARVYDYLIGGKLNYAIDREFAERILEVRPESKELAVLNRRWLRRAVRFGAEQGIRQFLDIGSGMPTVGHVHEIVQSIAPECRVVYVDNEPVAVAHSEIVLKDNDNAEMVQADAEFPDTVLEHPTTERLLDFGKPVMVVMAAFVHFVPDERNPAGLVAGYLDALVPGSYLALSSGTFEGQGEEVRRAAELYQKSGTHVVPRSREELRALVDGLEIVPPGIVFTPLWRPDDPADVGEHPEQASQLALVARKN
ncbi:SAM-dependent methyltransferase [Amycolatopsis sp. NPDC026612]|uniref:SAM-dependent methyltransferase n=1 Tax=Amycolatopsis sp. NPDC026612 TaxID=3155466 RepID=UPI0034085EC5